MVYAPLRVIEGTCRGIQGNCRYILQSPGERRVWPLGLCTGPHWLFTMAGLSSEYHWLLLKLPAWYTGNCPLQLNLNLENEYIFMADVLRTRGCLYLWEYRQYKYITLLNTVQAKTTLYTMALLVTVKRGRQESFPGRTFLPGQKWGVNKTWSAAHDRRRKIISQGCKSVRRPKTDISD